MRQQKYPEKELGKKAGFAMAFLVFTGIMTLVLSHAQKGFSPQLLLFAASATAAVTIAGFLVRKASS